MPRGVYHKYGSLILRRTLNCVRSTNVQCIAGVLLAYYRTSVVHVLLVRYVNFLLTATVRGTRIV